MSTVEPVVQAWADKIRPHLTRTVEAIVATGRELIAAKDALPHGSFGPLLDELGLSRQVANRFMRIARHPAIADRPREGALPVAVNTLDVLTQLDDERLAEAIEAGEITPTTTRAEAEALIHHPIELARRAAIAEGDAAFAYVAATAATIPATIEEAAIRLADLDDEIRRYTDQAVSVFLKYRGAVTDEGDIVTIETFAEHAGIPGATLRGWCSRVAEELSA